MHPIETNDCGTQELKALNLMKLKQNQTYGRTRGSMMVLSHVRSLSHESFSLARPSEDVDTDVEGGDREDRGGDGKRGENGRGEHQKRFRRR